MSSQDVQVALDEGDMIVGYVATFKVLSKDGTYYWATRVKEVNDMEALGIAHDMTDMFQSDLRLGRKDSKGWNG